MPKSLSSRDTDLAVSIAAPKERKNGRKRRCINCGIAYPLEELNPEYDAEERVIGLICDGCY